ncbi:hypothetical protein AYO20_09837 [Fonsecaea nubica]|uniref:Uncharacterized protein n=1 Tax=Fonsecaea nubica TaxID=856822 RepID=A0A178CB72_9EURO|nr:hypothetical protein AYO20_09837 [Fonsecaea nubica]OAL27239.1 hypothetical protein AYO20_09837 [Fonsecaea nubica]
MPFEPGDCPFHRVVERSFLNQICEDCLLAELGSLPTRLTSITAGDAQPDRPGNGEGLIWDSEVKIEIEFPGSGFSASPHVPEASVRDQEVSDDDWRILESHVEVTIEDEHQDIITGRATSPEIVAEQRNDQPQSSSIQISRPCSPRGEVCPPSSVGFASKRYGRVIQKNKTVGFDGVDSDSGVDLGRSRRDPPPLFRGRSLMCSNFRNARIYEPDADSSAIPTRTRLGFGDLPKLQSLKGLSTSLRMAPRSFAVAPGNCGNSRTGSASSSSSTGTTSKKHFQNNRNRKDAPRAEETSETMLVGIEQLPDDVQDIRIRGTQDTLAIPPRKSSLKNFALFLMDDFRRTKATVQPRSGCQSRSLTPSPTTSWLRQQAESSEETTSTAPSSVSHSGTTFDSAPRTSGVHTDSAEGMRVEKGFLIPSIPKSSTMNTMRAIIDGCIDLDVAINNQKEAVRRPPSAPFRQGGSWISRWVDR